jgi:hypothetical protein
MIIIVDRRQIIVRSSSFVAASTSFLPLAFDKRQTRTAFLTPPGPPQEPVRDADHLRRLVPVLPLLGVLNSMVDNAALLVKLKLEDARELIVRPARTRDNARNFLNDIADRPAFFLLRLAACLPLDNQLFVTHMRRSAAILDQALRYYLELHVAENWDSTPCDWCGP